MKYLVQPTSELWLKGAWKMVPKKLSGFLKDIRYRSHAVPCKQIPSCIIVGFSQDNDLCIKPVCGPAQAEDNV